MEKTSPNVRPLTKEDFSNVCRLCLINSPVASIFALKYEKSLFSEIISEMFSTQVNSEHELPKNICAICISEVIRFYNFRKVLIASEKILQAIITKDLNKTLHSPTLEDTEIKLDFVSTMTISNNDLSEDLIKETYGSNEQLLKPEDEIISVYSSNEDEIQIDCNTTTDNISTTDGFLADRDDSEKLQQDFILENVNIDLQVGRFDDGVNTKTKSLQQIFTCSCQKTFSMQSEYVKHRKEEKHPRPRNHTCQICAKNFTKRGLSQHMVTHTKEKPYECKICSKKFGQLGNLSRHTMIHTGVKPHVCEFCGKGFIQRPELTSHKRIHTGEKPFLCTYCGNMYGNRGSYTLHLQEHQVNSKEGDDNKNEKSHQGQFCQKVFLRKVALDQHLLRHGEKKFLCSYCGKKFQTNCSLETHLRLHTGEKPYLCNFCSKSFAQSSSLQLHILTHTGDKRFKCTICSKAFTQKPHLRTHLRIHSGEKPYTCPHCKKAFSDNRNLRSHIRTHTGETPYMCDLCPRGFYKSSNLKKHRQRHLEESKVEKKGE